MTDFSLSMFRDRDDMIEAMRREIVRLRKIEDLAKNIAGIDNRLIDYSGVLPDAVREWKAQAITALKTAQ